MEKKVCESCGMPMETKEQFGGGNRENKYCVYCCDAEGHLFPWETKVEHMAQFIQSTMSMDLEKAIQMAKENLVLHPAWKDYAGRI